MGLSRVTPSIRPRRIPSPRRGLRPSHLCVPLALAACTSAGHLAEYDFRDRTVAVVTVAPPHPQVLTGDAFLLEGEDVFGTLLRAGTEVLRELSAEQVRPKLDSAVAVVDVSGRMADRFLEQGARLLRAQSSPTTSDVDFEFEIRVESYGIEADSWDSQANFFVNAEVFLLDGETGRQIWKTDISERDPINRSVWGGGEAVSGWVTAQALASLSTSEIVRALEALADYSADRMADKLRASLDKARS